MTNNSHRIAKRVGVAIGAILFFFFFGVLILASISNWNPARPYINRTVSAALDRPFAIHGDLKLSWVRSVDSQHWRLPRPRVFASDIEIANVEWGKADQLARVKSVTAVFDPFPLFNYAVVLPLLEVEQARIGLERRQDGSNNWTFGKENKEPSRWRFAPGLLRVTNSSVQLEDAQRQLALRAEANSDNKGIHWSAGGTLNQASLKARGSAGSLLALQDKTTPYPIDFFLESGATQIRATGTLTNPSQLAALDVQLNISGESMSQLFPLTGIVLPRTGVYATDGRLRGTLDEYGGKWRYENFHGTVGNSDLNGTVVYEARPERPLITAKLISHLLNFSDLAPLIGADSNSSKARREASVEQPADKALPVEPFKTESWKKIDAQVEFDGEKILREQALPIENLHAVVDLKDGVLKFHPLNFGFAGGQLNSNIVLDGNKNPMRGKFNVVPKHLKLAQLFPTVEAMKSSKGEINGGAVLDGTGNSISALLGSADGEVKLFVDRGTVSRFILEAAGLNVANAVASKLFGDRQVNLNCAAADFSVEKGVMTTRGFVVDTDAALIDINGHIDLAQERLQLVMKPDSKGLRILTLRAPLYVNGTFKNPDIGVDTKTLALRSGAALALGAVVWPAALVPLVAPGPNDQEAPPLELTEDNGCRPLMQKAAAGGVSMR